METLKRIQWKLILGSVLFLAVFSLGAYARPGIDKTAILVTSVFERESKTFVAPQVQLSKEEMERKEYEDDPEDFSTEASPLLVLLLWCRLLITCCGVLSSNNNSDSDSNSNSNSNSIEDNQIDRTREFVSMYSLPVAKAIDVSNLSGVNANDRLSISPSPYPVIIVGCLCNPAIRRASAI